MILELILFSVLMAAIGALALRVRLWMNDMVTIITDSTAGLLQRHDDKLVKRDQRANGPTRNQVEEELLKPGQPVRRH